MRQRFSWPGAARAGAALIIGSAVVVSTATAAGAAGASPPKASFTALEGAKPAADATADPTSTASLPRDGADEDAACSRVRRKLWVEGEGWIVRRVTTCR